MTYPQIDGEIFYSKGMLELLGLPNADPTDVAYACMVHIRSIQREAYRTRLASIPKPSRAAQERAIAKMARQLPTGLDDGH